MGEAKRRGTLQQREAVAKEDLAEFQKAQIEKRRQAKINELKAAQERYDREVAELGEEKAARREQARRDLKHKTNVQVAMLAGMIAGALGPRYQSKPKVPPASLEDFENL
jgi:uncharacterized membrane protein YdbT with pleckstrin-like domain